MPGGDESSRICDGDACIAGTGGRVAREDGGRMLDLLDISIQAGRKPGVDIHVSRSFLEEAAMLWSAAVAIGPGAPIGKE